MITNQQLVQNNFKEKIKIFMHAVDGEVNSDETRSIANTGDPTDTFTMLWVKCRNINDSFKLKHKQHLFIQNHYRCSVWMDARHMSANWENILKKYNLKEAERNVMMKRENTLHVGEKISNQLTITQVKSNEELLKYVDVFISLFEGSTEQ